MTDSDAVNTILIELSRYMRLNPLACDTIEGITAWWLNAPDAKEADVLQALDLLQRGGLLQSHRAADGRIRYRRADRTADIEELLARLLEVKK